MGRLSMVLALLTGCAHGSAHLVQRDRIGGVIELGSGRDASDQARAEAIMSEQCKPATYEVVSEGEEAIGTSWSTRGMRTKNAWRIHYECRTER